MAHLPPPDPNEASEPKGIELSAPAKDLTWARLQLSAPAVVFLTGPPTAEEDRLADAILEQRPGALVVVARLT